MSGAYRPGSWTGLAAGRALVLIDAPAGTPVVLRLWPLVRDGASIEALLAALTGDGLVGLPSFGLVCWSADSSGVVVVVRGAAVVSLAGDRAVEVAARDVLTWVEARHPVPRAVAVHASGADSTGPALPLIGGVVPASRIEHRFTSETETETETETEAEPEPETEADPVPAPPEPLPPAAGPEPPGADTLAPPVSDTGYRTTASTELIDGVPRTVRAEPQPGADHRGDTLRQDVVAALRGGIEVEPVPRMAPAERPSVLAVSCPVGHLNPPHAHLCRVCDARIDPQGPVPRPRPVLGELRFDHGGPPVLLDRDVVIGRNPQAIGVADRELPRLHPLTGPGKNISRSHLRIRVDGWDVLVEDLGSQNGTEVQPPGATPYRLRPHEPVPLPLGSRISVAGEATCVYQAVVTDAG